MAVLLGNIALLLDGTSPRSILPDRKSRPIALDVLLNLPKPRRESSSIISVALAAKSFESDGEMKNLRRRRANSKFDAVDFEADDEESGEEEGESWESRMRNRLKEMEESKELERKAEELQSRKGGDEGEDGFGEEETEEEKRMRVRRELEKVAKEQAERRATAKLMFDLGQKAYGRGMYSRAIEFFEGALTIIPKPTVFGGEIQIWLAMAYEANDRHADCIAVYTQLEKKHPIISIRRQAAELRYILQAPKLKISKDEMVSIPLIGSSYDSYAGTWTDKYKDQPPSPSVITTNQQPSTKDYLSDFLVWRPPIGWEKNQVFWFLLTMWLGLVGIAVIIQR